MREWQDDPGLRQFKFEPAALGCILEQRDGVSVIFSAKVQWVTGWPRRADCSPASPGFLCWSCRAAVSGGKSFPGRRWVGRLPHHVFILPWLGMFGLSAAIRCEVTATPAPVGSLCDPLRCWGGYGYTRRRRGIPSRPARPDASSQNPAGSGTAVSCTICEPPSVR